MTDEPTGEQPAPWPRASRMGAIPAALARAARQARSQIPSLRDYRQLRHTWKSDLLAGVTVGIVALPLALGFGVSSGVSAEAGLITAIIAGLIAAVFGGSNVQVSGPTGAMVVVAAIQAIVAADWTYVPWSLGAAALVAGCMVFLPRIHRSLPGSLVGIVVATVLSLVIANDPLAIIGLLPNTLPAPSLPFVDPEVLGTLLLPAFTVAALAAIESLLSARVAAALDDTGPHDADRELVGQGLASIGSGFFGGMPATGAIARTAVNVRSGGRTRLASATHAIVLLAIVFVAAGPVGAIPLAALAGILMVTAARMVQPATVRSILRSTRSDAVTFVVTAIVTVSFDLIVAVLVGVVLLGIVAIRNMSRASNVTRDPIRGDTEPGDDRIAVLRLDGPLIFASSDRVFDTVTKITNVQVVVLRMSQLELIDASGAHVLTEIVQSLERRGITVLIKGVQSGHERLFRSVGVLASLRHHRHLFADMEAAVAHARSHVRRDWELRGRPGSG